MGSTNNVIINRAYIRYKTSYSETFSYCFC